jgi:hypothetical protein
MRIGAGGLCEFGGCHDGKGFSWKDGGGMLGYSR